MFFHSLAEANVPHDPKIFSNSCAIIAPWNPERFLYSFAKAYVLWDSEIFTFSKSK